MTTTQSTNWNALGTLGVQALKDMDRSRQERGKMLDRAGYGPNQTPSTFLHAEPGLRLHRFGQDDNDGPAVLLVPAPIKRAYIWDLTPQLSVVRRWLERGYRVYQAEWVPVHDTGEGADNGADQGAAKGADFGLADYGDRLLSACRTAIEADSGPARMVIAGHSLGGVLAAIYSCMHPERVAATILLESPLHFEPASCCFNRLVQATPHARDIADTFNHVPGAFLNIMSAMAEPHAFQWERMMDRTLSMFDPEALSTHMRVERWTHDEFPMPGRLFTDIVESLYRNDDFMQGRLLINGRHIGPQDLRAPLASVVDPRSKVIPLQSVVPFNRAAANTNKLVLEYEGDIGVNLQHVGVLVGRNAHARIWPALFNWLETTEA
jgi:polyhydroxyalkanoate synthase